MRGTFRVILPVEIDGQIYNFGEVIQLDLEAAVGYSHALMSIAQEREDASESNGLSSN